MKKWVTKKYQIKSDKLQTDTLRIVFISDLHNISIGVDNDILLAKVDELQPDLVLIGGDTIVGKPGTSMAAGLQFITALARRHLVYAANGNHEYRLRIYPEVYGDMYEQYYQTLKEANVVLLENAKTSIQIKGIEVTIYGYELERCYYQRLHKKKIKLEQAEMVAQLGAVDDAQYNILLAHNPKYGASYLDWGADLTLCGHYHGGVIRLGQSTPLLGNDLTLFPRYAYGHHQQQERHLLTSAGLGEHTIPLRINNPRELVVVDVKPK